MQMEPHTNGSLRVRLCSQLDSTHNSPLCFPSTPFGDVQYLLKNQRETLGFQLNQHDNYELILKKLKVCALCSYKAPSHSHKRQLRSYSKRKRVKTGCGALLCNKI